jgi:hypothetical protein
MEIDRGGRPAPISDPATGHNSAVSPLPPVSATLAEINDVA